MWKNTVGQYAQEMTIIWRMRFACWRSKAPNTRAEYIIFITFPVATQTVFNVTLRVLCLTCFIWSLYLIISITFPHQLGRNGPVSLSSNCLFKGLPNIFLPFVLWLQHYFTLILWAFLTGLSPHPAVTIDMLFGVLYFSFIKEIHPVLFQYNKLCNVFGLNTRNYRFLFITQSKEYVSTEILPSSGWLVIKVQLWNICNCWR